MKKLWLGIIGLAAASTANAAVVTYTLAIGDDGTGSSGTPGVFAVYADVSQADNQGLFAFGADLTDNQLDGIANMSTNWLYRKTTGTTGPNRFAGFGTGIGEDAPSGKLSGVTDLARGTALLPVYGFGQKAIDMNAVPPGGPRPNIGGVQYNQSTDQNPNSPGSLVSAHMLLGTGSFSPGHLPAWQVGSVDNAASVYDSVQDATGTKNTAVIPVLMTTGIPPSNSVTFGPTPTQPIVATGGAIVVTGANGKYNSEVDALTADALIKGSAPIQTIGDEPGSIYVLMSLNGTPADIQAVNTESNAVGPSDSQFLALHQAYDSKFLGGVDAIFKFDNTTGQKIVNFDFSATHPGVTVDQIAAVPEPTTMTLLGLASLGMFSRRRRKA